MEDEEGLGSATNVRPLHRPLLKRKALGEITAGSANISSLEDPNSPTTDGLHPIVAAEAEMLGEGATDKGSGSGLVSGLESIGDGGGVPKSAGLIAGRSLSQ